MSMKHVCLIATGRGGRLYMRPKDKCRTCDRPAGTTTYTDNVQPAGGVVNKERDNDSKGR